MNTLKKKSMKLLFWLLMIPPPNHVSTSILQKTQKYKYKILK